MEQREKRRTEQIRIKLVIMLVAMTLMVTQLPLQPLIHAESNIATITLKDETDKTQTIQVESVKEGIQRVVLMRKGEIIETKDVEESISFEVYTNGTYELLGYDGEDQVVGEQSITVDTLEAMEIQEDPRTHQITILSRDEGTYQIRVNAVSETTIDAVETSAGVYQAIYQPEKNGFYTFSAIDINGKTLHKKTLEITTIPQVSKRGQIVLSNEDDLKQIVADPSGDFILSQDIEIKGTPLKGVVFQGTLDGQGHTIQSNGPLFEVMDHATVRNIVVKGSLASNSRDSSIEYSGFYVEGNDAKQDLAVIMKSEDTTIQNSFVLMNVEGKNVAGFVLEGHAEIKDSYVSGYMKGQSVYGFGRDVDIEDSYISASLVGKKRHLFSEGKRIDCFYDAQINDLEDEEAQPYLSDEITSGTLHNEAFLEKKGSYPQIKTSIAWKEQAQKTADLSVVRVASQSNLSAMTDSVRVIEQKDDNIEWNKEVVRPIDKARASNGELCASTEDMENRFALQTAASVPASVGKPTTSTKTEITYPVEMGKYYIVKKSGDITPTAPKTHKEAIESGWKRMYWDGSHTANGLEWHTNYTVYETDLTSIKVRSALTTDYGKNKGTLSLSGTYDIGQTMTATLSDTNTMKGTLYWERAETADAKTWTTIKQTTMDDTKTSDTYTVTGDETGKYLRVRFETDETSGYKGTLQATSEHSVKVAITNIEIENKEAKTNGQYTLTDRLNVKLTPNKLNDATYAWYQEGKSEAIGTGMNYTIKGSDVGKKLYVKATAKADGELTGTQESNHTTVVQAIQCTTPSASTTLTDITYDDITVKVKIGASNGLYRIGIKKDGDTTITEHSVALRGGSDTTITGLEPNTKYQLYVKELGEEGYTDSEWSSDSKEFTTDKRHVQGDVTISGDLIYGKKLTANVTNIPEGQTGEVNWYRLKADGSRDENTKKSGPPYVLSEQDVDHKIELVYSGTGTYAGEISFISDEISRAEKVAPTQNLTITSHNDTTIEVQMPTNSTGEQYIIGRSTMENGVPVEELDSTKKVKILNSGEKFTITGLERDTTYYFSIRYAQSATHQKSDWTAQNIIKSQKTEKKEFKGAITFKYQTSDLLRGQTLTAELGPQDPDFNYQGEWTWTKIATNGKETPITNYTLAENRGSTSYVIPDDEEYGTTYRVTFTATVGYEGNATPATSNSVKEKEKSQYTKPIANNIIMEAIDDMSFKVRMSSGAGQYQFEYKKADTNAIDSLSGWFNVNVLGDSTDGYMPVGEPVNSNVDVVVEGLDRNTTYTVRVKRIEDGGGLASDYANSSDKSEDKTVTTAKTTITGYVTIDGTERSTNTLTATYHPATYASTGTGNDTEGTWQWYRGERAIPGANSATYTITGAYIGSTLKAVYTMPSSHAFTGSAEAYSGRIAKPLPEEYYSGGGEASCLLTFYEEGIDDSDKMWMSLSSGNYIRVYGYYRVQKEDEPAPAYPSDSELESNWISMRNSSATPKIWEDSHGQPLEANTTYVVYYMAPERSDVQGMEIKQLKHTMGTKQQKGIISITGNYVVGKTLTATLDNPNNIQGTWKWYSSNSRYNGSSVTTSPSLTDTSKWTELTEGYSPMSNSKTSQLILTENLFGKYIKVEFVPNTEQGYSGTIVNPINNNGFVKKIYEETITLTSSTNDGNGKPKAYAGTTLTATVNNSEETTLDRDIKRFKIGNSYVTGDVSGNKFTYTIPTTSTSTYTDGAEVIAEISTPKVPELYVNKNLTALSSANLNSKNGTGSTNTYFTYAQGIPISSADDLLAFMDATRKDTYKNGLYASNTANYIITNNITLTGEGISPTKLRGFHNNGNYVYESFQGTLDGDYHTIAGLKNTMFFFINGESNPVVIKNMIILNANITVGNVSSTNDYNSAGILVGNSNGTLGFENIFLIDSNLTATYDCGYFLGRANDMFANTSSYFKNCGSVGGKVTAGWTAGGLGGNIGSAKVTDCYTIGTTFKGGTNTLSIGAIIKGKNIVTNYYTATYFDTSGAKRKPFGHEVLSSSSKNLFYDTTLAGTLTVNSDIEVGKTTEEMIGDQLKGYFGDTGTWKYETGFYPRLTWMGNNKIANLYSATRGAFKSVDGITSQDNLFNGKVKGVIQIPDELRGAGYTVSFSNPSSVDHDEEHGTFFIKGNVGVSTDVTITYTDPSTGATASNTFTFQNTASSMVGYHSVDSYISPQNTIPSVGDKLSALSASLGSNLSSYQWYRLKQGSNVPEVINGATSYQYTVNSADLGSKLTCLMKPNSGYGYYSAYTPYTETVINKDFDNVRVDVRSMTDSSLVVSATNGSASYRFEFAYERADANGKIMVDGTYLGSQIVTINNLERNKQYKVYARVAAGDGYDAGKWSPAATQWTSKTDVTGSINLGRAVNNGSELTMSIDKLNGQTGTWKVERLESTTDTVIAVIDSNLSSENSCGYILQEADVGNRIRVTFTGSGDYKGTKTAITGVIKKTATAQPTGTFNLFSRTDTQLVVTTPSGTSGNIEVGYADSATAELTVITGDGGITAGTDVTVSGLTRNKTYYFSYRIAETAGAEASPWSTRTPLSTDKTKVENDIRTGGSITVDGNILFQLNDTNKPTGTWTLQRTKNGRNVTISPDLYTVEPGNAYLINLVYKVQPKDTGGTLTATFTGTGDFFGTASKTSVTIQNASQNTTTDMPNDLNVKDITDNSMTVNAVDGPTNYQFAYRKDGDESWTPLTQSVTAGTDVKIEGLERNTLYRIAVRKSAKTGYNASNWVEKVQKTTSKTKLNGLVDYVMVVDGGETAPKIGVAEVNKMYKATYHKGSYPQTASDDKAGHWQWYAGKTPIDGATLDTYTIAPMNGSPEISVHYIANDDSDFSGEVIGRVGTLTKPFHEAPSSLPIVTALAEDGEIRSKMKITNTGNIDAVYYYVQKASNQKVPELIFASAADGHKAVEDTWFKATSDVTLTLDANIDYVVYLARLEDGSHQASGVVSQRAVRTKKEDLSSISSAIITETNDDIWKVEETKEIYLTNHGKAPTGIWQYYVSPDKTNDNSWINITAQIKVQDTSKDGRTATTFSVPVKYNGYYVKAVFSGRGDYEGIQTYIATDLLIGTQIKGHAEITTGDSREVLVPIQVEYVFAKEDDNEIEDEANGQWTWYRIKDGKTTQIMKEDGTTPYGKTGRSDSYTPGKDDVGAKIYAIYHSARNGIYSGEVKTKELENIERAAQTKPGAPTLKQVDGITIQMNLPTNYRSDGTTIPETILKYRVQGASNWTINAKGESWIGKGSNKLKANTQYEICATYEGTGEYLPSEDSDVTTVTTGSIPLSEANLSITQEAVIEAGTTITATYRGAGYDEGLFTIERSDGTILSKDEAGTNKESSTSYTYTSTSNDIGNRIIVRYTAKPTASTYGGSVEKSSNEVVKPKNSGKATKPTMKTELDTNLYVTNVQKTQEYILLKSGENIKDRAESDWTPLQADNNGRYEFTHLKRNTSYVLYTRLAETPTYAAGDAMASDAIRTLAYNDAGSMEVQNQNDGSAASGESKAITIPQSLKRGDIKISGTTITNGDTPLDVLPVSTFADEGDNATQNTIERGSDWANRNFGLRVNIYDGSGNLIDRKENGETLNVSAIAATMKVEIYRANAVSDGGPYTWSLTLTDSEDETAIYQGKATMITQLQSLSPIKIDLNLDGQRIEQSTNDATIQNAQNHMPVTLGVDTSVTKGAKMPSLMGSMDIGLSKIEVDKAYLKLSTDGSDFNKKDGVWFTTDTTNTTKPIYELGYKGNGGFYISGAVSKDQTWTWDSGDTRTIEQAYQIRFITGISKRDVGIYGVRSK